MNKLMLTLIVLQVAALDKITARREAGQGTLEYVGMIAVAAIVILAILTAVNAADMGSIFTAAVAKVKAMA